MSNHWSSLSLLCSLTPQSSRTFTSKPESLSLTLGIRLVQWVDPWVRIVFSLTWSGELQLMLTVNQTWAQVQLSRIYLPCQTSCQSGCRHVFELGCLMVHLNVCLWGCMMQTVCRLGLGAVEAYTDGHTERLSSSLDVTTLNSRSKSWLENQYSTASGGSHL